MKQHISQYITYQNSHTIAIGSTYLTQLTYHNMHDNISHILTRIPDLHHTTFVTISARCAFCLGSWNPLRTLCVVRVRSLLPARAILCVLCMGRIALASKHQQTKAQPTNTSRQIAQPTRTRAHRNTRQETQKDTSLPNTKDKNIRRKHPRTKAPGEPCKERGDTRQSHERADIEETDLETSSPCWPGYDLYCYRKPYQLDGSPVHGYYIT